MLTAVRMDPQVARQVAEKLLDLVAEADIVQMAIDGMPHESAMDYLSNWVKRHSGRLN
jgi:hypothetical protein